MDVTPSAETPVVNEEQHSAEDGHDHSRDLQTPEQIVDEGLAELRSGSAPPMKAILKIRQVAEDHPENIYAQFTLGQLSMESGQFEKAIERFTNVVTIDPNNADGWLLLARSMRANGDMEGSKEPYKKALELATSEVKETIQEEIKEIKEINI